MTHRLFITLLMVMLVSLPACKSKTRAPQPISPPTAAPSPGLPSSTPTGEQEQSGAAGSQDRAQDRAQRESAGDDLRKSGEMIANSGARIGDQATATGAGESPQKDSPATQDEPDALLPESDASAIERARDALETAGDSLTKAGDTVADAVTEEELATAEAQLADARIAVIIAEQEIGSLKDSPYYEDAAELVEIEAALEQANVVLVVATRAVLNARTGMPDFPAGAADQATPTSSQGEVAVLEGELEGSLEIFDDRMNKARGAAIATTGVATTPTRESGINSPPSAAKAEEGQAMEPEGEPVVVAVNSDVPEDIPSAQGDDIVAQQLREAAIAETNPALKEKLWVEYKRYKAGL